VKLFYYDGIPRKRSQLDDLLQRECISVKNTIAVVLHASRATCEARFIHRCMSKSGGQRPEPDSLELFRKRYDNHDDELEGLTNKILALKIPLHHVDANKPLDAFPLDVVAVARARWGESGQVPIINRQTSVTQDISNSDRVTDY
jgi:hypothetical protein